MTETYDVVIIGAGIGGLCTGLHLADKGYKTLILESHASPGGLCTSFERKGFTFDTCIHWLVGCGEGGILWHTLNRFGLFEKVKLRRLDRLVTVRASGGVATIGDDLSEFERFLCRLSPRDEKELMRFFRQARRLPRMVRPSAEYRKKHPLRSMGMLLSYLPVVFLAMRYGKYTQASFLSRFHERDRVRPYLSVGIDDFSVMINFYVFSWVHRHDLFAPQISSLEFARAFESRFVEMGGAVRYRSRVAKVLVESGKAAGVRLESGEEIRARTVVSNADGYLTLFQLLGKEVLPGSLVRFYETAPLFGSMLIASLGVGVPLSEKEAPARMVSEFVTPEATGIKLSDFERAPVTYKIESLYNPAAAPPGKGVVLVEALADYREWSALRQDMGRYREAKERAAEIAVRRAEECFPQLKGRVETVDVATPVTFERYTSNREGSTQGWAMTPKMMRRMALPFQPVRIPNFFMAGQWVVVGGGIPGGVISGEKVAARVDRYLRGR